MCPIQYVVSVTNLIKPTTPPPLLLPLIHTPYPLACNCGNKLPVQYDRKRLVSRAVTESQAGATKAFALIESRGREAARFGEALIDSLIRTEGPQKYALQSRPINQTIKPGLCSWLWSI